MHSILFVDDEPLLLRSMERELWHVCEDWELLFADTADNALKIMARTPVDVLIADYMMPQMSGIELLMVVESLYPRTLRILLTGYAGKIKYAQTSNICHFFFEKPYRKEGLKRLLARAAIVLELLDNPQLIEHLNAIACLPVHPDSFKKLESCFNHYDIQPQQLLHLADKDVSLALQLFRLSSSANFMRAAGIDSLADAIDYIDMENFRSLLEAQQLFVPDDPDRCRTFELDLLQQHSFQVVQIAEALAALQDRMDILAHVRLAALLHDAGRIALVHALPTATR
jgi:response regulator RpfG family c-di-GMP phosphodiesterase